MQGKERNITKIDKQFRDRSWGEMQKILDSEMPQVHDKENGKKRLLPLLFFLLIGFGFGLGTMAYFNGNEKNEVPNPVEESTKEVAKIEKIAENNPQSITEQSNTISSKIAESTLNKVVRETKDQFSDFAIQISPSKQNNVISENLLVTDLQEKEQSSKNRSLQSIENPIVFKHSDLKLSPIQNMEGVIPKIDLLELLELDEKFESSKKAKPKKWSFGILLGNYFNDKSLFAGATFGGKVNYSLNRKLSIGGGIQYSILAGYQKKKLINSNRAADELDSVPGNGIFDDTTSTSSNPNEESFVLDNNNQTGSGHSDLPISHLHYIEIPLEFAFRITKKIQVNLGAKAGYLISANWDKKNVSFDNNSNVTRSQNSFSNSLEKLDFATSIGLGFYPSKQIGIDLRYNHGLVDITKDDHWLNDQINTNKNIQLSVLYLFGKK